MPTSSALHVALLLVTVTGVFRVAGGTASNTDINKAVMPAGLCLGHLRAGVLGDKRCVR